MTGPDRADFAGCVIADCYDEIELRCSGVRELIPALAAQTVGGQVQVSQQLKRQRVDLTLRETAGAVGAKLASTMSVQQGLREDASRGVAGAQEEHVVRLAAHRRSPLGGLQIGRASCRERV